MAFNIFALVAAALQDAAEVQIAGAELAAGQAVEAPGKIQVGTTAGKAVYLFGVLSTDPAYSIATAAQPALQAGTHNTTVTTAAGG